MKFWPSENLLFVTALEEEEIHLRMQQLLEGKNATYEGEHTGENFNITPLNKEEVRRRNQQLEKGKGSSFESEFSDPDFRLKRILFHRRSFVPVIIGNIEYGAGETMLWVKIRLHTFTSVLLILMLVVFVVMYYDLLRRLTALREISFVQFLPLIFPVGLYTMTMLAFKSGSYKVKHDLCKIFQARIYER